VLVVAQGRFYYLLPAFVMIIGAGAVVVERLPRRMAIAYAALIVIAGIRIAPNAVPVLPPAAYFRYVAITHVSQPRFEHRMTTSMPQFFADRFGWPEMAATVARAYYSIPPAERAKTAIFGNDYGQSGA